MAYSKSSRIKKYSGNELSYIKEYLFSDQLDSPQVPFTLRFERAFAERFSVPYAIAHNSGTSALHSSLAAVGVGLGDEVISPALTVIMDSYAAIHLGAFPVFADVDPETQNIDPEDVRKKITKRTKAIITVCLQGLPADASVIMKIAHENGIAVIEDCAQAMLARYDCTTQCPGCDQICFGKFSGTIGHLGVFSFESKKHLSTGEGGMVIAKDPKLAENVRKFGGIGYKHLTAETGHASVPVSQLQHPSYERFDALGLNYRMPEVCAAIGLAQFERVEELVARRQKIAQLYDEAIEGCKWLVRQVVPKGYEHTFYTYAVRYYGDQALGLSWKDFYEHYTKMGGDGFYGACKVPYLEPVYRNLKFDGRSYGQGLCPVAEEIQPRIMQFKTNYRDIEVARRKADILKKLIKKLGRQIGW